MGIGHLTYISANFHKKYIWWKCLFGRLSPAAASGHFVWSPLSEAQRSEPSHSLEKLSELVKLYLFCNPRLCRLPSSFSIHTSAVSLMGRVINRLWVSYLLRMSDDDHIDNNVEEKVGDWDPVLKSESVNITMMTLFPKSWFNIERVTM